jgi:hypothetical protein
LSLPNPITPLPIADAAIITAVATRLQRPVRLVAYIWHTTGRMLVAEVSAPWHGCRIFPGSVVWLPRIRRYAPSLEIVAPLTL